MTYIPTLPLHTSKFSDIRHENHLYVDKTEAIYQLVKNDGKYFFHRPRRFGKSLTISTLDSLFRGEKKLFAGLWIEERWDWQPRLVVRLNFSIIGKFKTVEKFDRSLNSLLIACANPLGLDLSDSVDWDDNFRHLLTSAAKRGKVVVLIDEYDYPLHACFENKNLQEAVNESLKEFYTILKGNDTEYIFIT